MQLFLFDGRLSRQGYALIGFSGVLIKHIIDLSVAIFVFKRSWNAFSYIQPFGAPHDIFTLSWPEERFAATMLLIAVPFVWVGVAATVRRLRAMDWPLWLAALFFIPIANLIFFALLCVAPDARERPAVAAGPSKPAQELLDRFMPVDLFGAAALSTLLAAFFGLGAMWLSTVVVKDYGWGLFVATPFCQGMLAAMVVGYRTERRLGTCLAVAALSVLLGALAMVALAFEGLICILMAAPLALVFSILGGIVGFFLQRRRGALGPSIASFLVALLAAPAVMAAHPLIAPVEPPLAVTTAVDIQAPPERVWRYVVAFPPLDPPDELIFKAGIAYPKGAHIHGRGRGAVRFCDFSTGSFVEPITQWREPALLAFDVIQNPEPMQELSPYAHLETPHLTGYLVAERGQFALEALSGGGTRLVGTTWYRHGLWPAGYWRLWSDALIHQIHRRVLNHIKRLAENPQS